MLAGDMAEPPPLETVRAVIAGDARHAPADVAERIQDYAARVAAAPRESDAVLDALDGRYIQPGPMADAVRNPDALPPGRNPYTFATRSLPTREAWATGSRMADALIENYRKEHGQAPRKVAFVLWSVESTQNRGAMEAQILRLMGARPVWNPRGEVIDVALDDRAALGRPRVDVLVTTSGTYRDHFGDKIAMLAKAARLAAAADERDNAVRANSLAIAAQLAAAGAPAAEARARADRRIYSTAPGAYSPSTQFALQAGADWTDARLSRLYTDRLGHAYGEGGNGAPDAQGFVAQLSGDGSRRLQPQFEHLRAARHQHAGRLSRRYRHGGARANGRGGGPLRADLKDSRPGAESSNRWRAPSAANCNRATSIRPGSAPCRTAATTAPATWRTCPRTCCCGTLRRRGW